MRTKDEAIVAGGRLLGMMEGDSWRLRVWENLGWHYTVESPPFTVSPSGDYKEGRGKPRYFCLMADRLDRCGGTGSGMWTTRFISGDPNEVVRVELAQAEEVFEMITAAMEQARNVVGTNGGGS